MRQGAVPPRRLGRVSTAPDPVRGRRRGHVLQQVRTVAQTVATVGGLRHERLRLDGPQPLRFQDPRHSPRAADDFLVGQFVRDPSSSVAAFVPHEDGHDSRDQLGVFPLTRSGLGRVPGVVCRPIDAEHFADRRYRLASLAGNRFDGGVNVGQTCRPKMANAFFRMSRSRSTRSNSASSWRTRSSRRSATGPALATSLRFQR